MMLAKKFQESSDISPLILKHAIHVTTANITDRNGAISMVEKQKSNLSEVENIMVDFGYSGENFANEIKKLIDVTVEVVKRDEVHTFKVIPKRWVVERSFGWIEKCRRLWKNCERAISTSLQLIN